MKLLTLITLTLTLFTQQGYSYDQGNLICESKSDIPKYTFYIMRDWKLSAYYSLELYEIEYSGQANAKIGSEEKQVRLPLEGCQGVRAIWYKGQPTGADNEENVLTLECPIGGNFLLDLNIVDGKAKGGIIKFPEGAPNIYPSALDEDTELELTCSYN